MDEELNFCPASKWSCHMSCDGMAASCIFYFLSILVQNSFVSPVSRGYQNVTLLEPETPNTWTLYWGWIIQCEMKTRKEREVWCKNYTADVGHWHSQVLWDYLLFGCYSILISFQHQHWSSQHIKWTEHRSSVCSVFVPFSINRSLCPNVGARGQHTPACLPRSEACHYQGLERLAHNRELPANCGQIQTANRDH